MKTPRPYQKACLDALFNYLYTPNTGNPLVVAPVSAGKSMMIAETIKRIHSDFPRTRIVVLTHVKELLEQNAKALLEQYSDADFGFYCSGLGQKKLHNDITFASVQSVANKASAFARVPEVIIIDECHLISHKEDTSYRKFFDAVLAINPACKIIGYTGTPFRSDSGRLDEGENALFDDVVFDISMKFMIDEGYWTKPVSAKTSYQMTGDGIAVRGGEYMAKQIEEKYNTAEVNNTCVKELVTLGRDRNKWLAFTATVKHCEDVLSEIRLAGVSAEMITGKTPADERRRIIKDFRQGRFTCLVNVAVLTTGFDVSDIDLICYMRPMRSAVLYVQTIGRGVRTHYADGFDLATQRGRLDAINASTKKDVLIVDFGGVIAELGPVDDVTITKVYRGEKKGEGEATEPSLNTKFCPKCNTPCHNGQQFCHVCTHQFFELDAVASTNAVISNDVEPEWFVVLSVFTSLNQGKEGKRDTLKATYATTEVAISEWLCFEHDEGSFPRTKACTWYNLMVDDVFDCPNDFPSTVDEALNKAYRKPTRILARKEGKFYRVLDYDFKELEGCPF